MKRAVRLFQRDGKILVVPLYTSNVGGYVEKGPVQIVNFGEWTRVGVAILEALDLYEEGLPMPDWTTHISISREAAGVATEDEFEEGLKGCLVEFGPDNVMLSPEETKVGRGLFPIEDAVFSAPLTSHPQTIGKLAEKGLSLAR